MVLLMKFKKLNFFMGKEFIVFVPKFDELR